MYCGLMKRVAARPPTVPTMVTTAISHLKRATALNTRRQSTPVSGWENPCRCTLATGWPEPCVGGGQPEIEDDSDVHTACSGRREPLRRGTGAVGLARHRAGGEGSRADSGGR